MDNIILTNPLNITLSAVKITAYSLSIRPNSIQVNLNYYDVDNNLIKSEIFNITGSNYNQLVNAVINENHVGQQFIDIIERAIRNKVKQLKGFVGNVPLIVY